MTVRYEIYVFTCYSAARLFEKRNSEEHIITEQAVEMNFARFAAHHRANEVD
ncbi:hypothetical protein P8936_09225 [Edaphobacter paludis]|uniref:Uncharacterized protein n=1 Tax=Edaphobacter paludis TaxID=3035702 RepID=A0AAU7CUD9_9BACT